MPIRTTLDDVDVICGYLATKPTGATLAEAKAVVEARYLDSRKIAALKHWGLIEEADNKIKIAEFGRGVVRDSGASRNQILRDVVRRIRPYAAVVERVVHGREATISATDVAALWHEHFRAESSDSDRILNDQAVCFFQVAQGADLGKLIKGRGGMATRFEFDSDAARAFVDEAQVPACAQDLATAITEEVVSDDHNGALFEEAVALTVPFRGNRVFLTHGENLKILDQVKQIVTFGKFEPVVAIEHETTAKPVPQKVMDEMKTCDAAVIHVSAERVLIDQTGNEVHLINENVLIEIGAAMALYDGRFVLLVEEGVKLPSNLQGLYECRYRGSELNMEATMKLLQAFNEFGQQ